MACAHVDHNGMETFAVRYIAPDGWAAQWRGVADFDALRRDQLRDDPDKRKGSWFARSSRDGELGWFRF